MSFSRWQKLSDRMIAKVVLWAEADADAVDADAIGAADAAIVLSVMTGFL
jgi:hypothetical protein